MAPGWSSTSSAPTSSSKPTAPEEFLAEYERKLPPIVAARAALEPEGKWEALRADLLELYKSENLAEDGATAPTASTS